MWQSFKRLDYADKIGVSVLVIVSVATIVATLIYVIQNGVKQNMKDLFRILNIIVGTLGLIMILFIVLGDDPIYTDDNLKRLVVGIFMWLSCEFSEIRYLIKNRR